MPELPAIDRMSPPAVWIDGHPLLEAIAAAVWEQCSTEGTSLVVDDPRNIAVAAASALPAPVDGAAVLRNAADGFDRHAAQILEGVGDKAVFVAKALRDQAAVWSEAAETLRRMAAEAPATEEQDGEPTGLMRAHVALAEQAGRDQAALTRLRELHDRLIEETDLHGPEDLLTRGSAARRIATALDGVNPAGLTPCTCRQTVHAQEHTNRPVDDCPWCMPAPNIRPNAGRAVETVDARLLRSNPEA